ncbi:MFS general substrate transporter [Hypoxylon sp. FL1857]|nr:MFS general substrate transporter [Hypoxylon sp. FL1857]
MALSIYWAGLLVPMPLVVLLIGHRMISRLFQRGKLQEEAAAHDVEAKEFRKTFLRVYLVVMGSEWLQSPYIYSLLREEKAIEERGVATLYIATYVSAALSAFLTGYMADRFGRKRACLAFCGIHSLASISVKFDAMWILMTGRVLSGIGLNLLWTSFESWMVTEYNARALYQSSLPLSAMFGIMTKYNCITAIFAGSISYSIVLVSGSKSNPFVVGVCLDGAAALLILWTWNENNGASCNHDSSGQDDIGCDTTSKVLDDRAAVTLRDTRIWVLSFASCCFEGTMFIFTFFWPGSLKGAHNTEYPEHSETTPYGVIFASFMAAMVLGAILFSFFIRNANCVITERATTFGAIWPTLLLCMALFLGASSFLIAALFKAELHLYLTFLLLEFCNGVYVPAMAYHRGILVEDSRRASTYGLMNIPLFVFVVAALYTTSSNGDEHRQTVFSLSAVLLLAAAVSVALGLGMSAIRPGFSRVMNNDAHDIESVDKDELALDGVDQV